MDFKPAATFSDLETSVSKPEYGNEEQLRTEVIDGCLQDYDHEFPHFRDLAEHVYNVLKKKLENTNPLEESLHARVTWRAKAKQSLREKVRLRDPVRNYRNWKHIKGDIYDLAGIRIELLFPGEKQRKKAEQVILDLWPRATKVRDYEGKKSKQGSRASGPELTENLQETEEYQRIHPGYQAVHYKVEIEESDMPNWTQYAEGDQFEIQVVSTFSYGWSEAQHDVEYKGSTYGKPPVVERRLLDIINGLAILGDHLLELLYELITGRSFKKFEHAGELSSTLWQMDILKGEIGKTAFPEKCHKHLFGCLSSIGEHYPLALRTRITKLGFPSSPNLDNKLTEYYPDFKADEGMKAYICLVHNMLQYKTDRNVSVELRDHTPMHKGRLMMAAFILLKDLAGDGGHAQKYLRDEVQVTDEERESLDWILSSTQRQIRLEPTYKGDMAKLESEISPAWEWFQKQEENPKSVCGLVFRLTKMEPIVECKLRTLLDQLSIGKLSLWSEDDD